MTNELAITHSVTEAGLVANHVAAQQVFADYQQRKSTNSLSAQRSDLGTFTAYLQAAKVAAPTADELQSYPEAWEGITWGLVAGFVNWMLKQGLALTSINRKLSTVKVYFGLAAQSGVLSAAELTMLKTVKGYAAKEFKNVDDKRTKAGVSTRVGYKKAKGAVLTDAQAKQLKEQPDTPQGRRDAVIMTLLIDLGLRVGELAALQVTDVDLKAGELRFYRPKVDKTQTHRLTKDAKRALRAYLPDALAMGKLLRASNAGGELTSPGMDRTNISLRVSELGRRIGIDNLSAHDCRHYWTTRAIRKGIDPFRVLQAGGWTSMTTVQKYVDETEIANEGMTEDEQ
jgi:integrase